MERRRKAEEERQSKISGIKNDIASEIKKKEGKSRSLEKEESF